MWRVWIACVVIVLVTTGAGAVVWRLAGRQAARTRRVGRTIAASLWLVGSSAAGLGVYLSWHLVMGQPEPSVREPRPGMRIERDVRTTPRRIVLHAVKIPMREIASIEVTPPEETDEGLRVRATKAVEAAAALDGDVVINGSFFFPFWSEHPLSYGPDVDDLVQVVGPTVGRGVRYGIDEDGWPAFSVTMGASGVQAEFIAPDASSYAALSGRRWLVRGGEQADVPETEPYPRTALGLDAAREHLWLVIVDGKQPRYSEGMTLDELSRWLVERGVADAIELDGGGSSVLALREGGAVALASRPCHTSIPGRERPVANHLAVRLRRR